MTLTVLSKTTFNFFNRESSVSDLPGVCALRESSNFADNSLIFPAIIR